MVFLEQMEQLDWWDTLVTNLEQLIQQFNGFFLLLFYPV